MRTLLGITLFVLALPMVASATVLLDEDFDGVPAGTNLEDLGWNGTGYTVSPTSIDVGHSTMGAAPAAEYLFNHTIGGPGEYYQIDAVVQGISGPAYFWAENADGHTIFFNHYQAWGNAVEFQTQAPPGITNAQRIEPGPGNPDPRSVRLEIYQDDAKLSYDPDGAGGFNQSATLSDIPGEAFGFTDLKLIKMSGGGGAFYDSIKVQVVGAGPPPPRATVFEWTTNDLGSWGSSKNWAPDTTNLEHGAIPNKNSHTAIFGDAISAPTSVVTHDPVTVNRIQFDNASNNYAIGGWGSVNLVSTTTPEPVPPTMDVTGTHEFQLEVNLQNSAEVNITSDSLLSFNNAFNLGGNTLTKTGAGTLAINNQLTTAGGSVNVQEGTVSGVGTIGGDVVVDGGTISPGNSASVQSAVPEPATAWLLVLGLLCGLGLRQVMR